MDKLIPTFIVVAIILLGFIGKIIDLKNITKRIDFTTKYHNKFVKLVNQIPNKNFDEQLYRELTINVNKMQNELGEDGIIHEYIDNLRGVLIKRYELLLNFLPELRECFYKQDDLITMERCKQSVLQCDDMFMRHIGTLNTIEESLKKHMFNPCSCFGNGIKFIISLPILLLNWIGMISYENTNKARHSWFMKLLNYIATIIGTVSAIVSIVLGWDEFLQKIHIIF